MKSGTTAAKADKQLGKEAGNGVRSRFISLAKWIRPASNLLDFWLESPCLLCQRSAAHVVCPTCQQRARAYQYPQLRQFQQQSGLTVLAWGDYRGDIQRMMRLLKYENQPKLGTLMGQWLATAWLAQSQSNHRVAPIIVPIPLHPHKLQQRGYNQADLIAQEFCRITQLPLVSQGLERIRETQPQFSLSAQDRVQNLSQAFQVADSLRQYRNQPVMLLDDIHTTGATAQSAAQALRQAGCHVLGVITVAKTRR
ncbi:MAG: ComF family protein [Thainema sp.]